jgi:transcriptional activator of comK gene
MQRQIKQSSVILCLAFLCAIILIGFLYYLSTQMFQAVDPSELKEEKPDTVILVSDAVADQSWGSHAHNSRLRVEEKFGIKAELFSGLVTDTLREYRTEKEAENGRDLIIGHGREYTEVFNAIAGSYPETKFVSLQGTPEHDNQAVYTYNNLEAEVQALLAGSIKSETKKIGVLSKEGDWKRHEEVETILQELCDETEVIHRTVESRNNKEEALQVLDELLAEGADVIYSRGNTFNRYVIEQAQVQEFYIIGFITDQAYLAEEQMITSVLIDVPKIYEYILEDYLSRDGLESGVHDLTNQEDRNISSTGNLGPMFTDKDKEELGEKMRGFSNNQ